MSVEEVRSQESGVRSLARISAALAPATHKTQASWRGMRERIAVLTDSELAVALDLEKLGKRRTEHLKLLDNEQRRRAGETGARKFKVETKLDN